MATDDRPVTAAELQALHDRAEAAGQPELARCLSTLLGSIYEPANPPRLVAFAWHCQAFSEAEMARYEQERRRMN
jgi:hypothetical protein